MEGDGGFGGVIESGAAYLFGVKHEFTRRLRLSQKSNADQYVAASDSTINHAVLRSLLCQMPAKQRRVGEPQNTSAGVSPRCVPGLCSGPAVRETRTVSLSAHAWYLERYAPSPYASAVEAANTA